MFPGFYIPTVFVKTGMWLEEGSPESVLLSATTVLGSSWQSVSWQAKEHGCHLSLPTGIIPDRTETVHKGNRAGTGFLEERSLN